VLLDVRALKIQSAAYPRPGKFSSFLIETDGSVRSNSQGNHRSAAYLRRVVSEVRRKNAERPISPLHRPMHGPMSSCGKSFTHQKLETTRVWSGGVHYVKRLHVLFASRFPSLVFLLLSLLWTIVVTMAIPKRALFLSSCALTFFASRYAPNVAFFPRSYFWNIATIFVIQVFAQWGWQIVVYPLFLSPLRHLPQPPVRLTSDVHDTINH
jgi:hypothetical protein